MKAAGPESDLSGLGNYGQSAALTVPAAAVERLLGYLAADQEPALVEAVRLAFDLD